MSPVLALPSPEALRKFAQKRLVLGSHLVTVAEVKELADEFDQISRAMIIYINDETLNGLIEELKESDIDESQNA